MTIGEEVAAFIRREWQRGRGAEDIAVDLGDGWTWGEVATILEVMEFDPFDATGALIPSRVP